MGAIDWEGTWEKLGDDKYILIVFGLKQYANFSKSEKQYVNFSNGIPKVCAFHYMYTCLKNKELKTILNFNNIHFNLFWNASESKMMDGWIDMW